MSSPIWGDGTYSHSGILAIRAAVASQANMTYKVLYNDAVAMTGGQPVELKMTPIEVVKQLLSEGVKPVRLVSDQPGQYAHTNLPANVSVHHRDQLEDVQRELREIKASLASSTNKPARRKNGGAASAG